MLQSIEKLHYAAVHTRCRSRNYALFLDCLLISIVYTCLGIPEVHSGLAAIFLIPAGFLLLFNGFFFLAKNRWNAFTLRFHVIMLYVYVVILGIVMIERVAAHYSNQLGPDSMTAGIFIIPTGIIIYLLVRRRKLLKDYLNAEARLESDSLEQFNYLLKHMKTTGKTDPETVVFRQDGDSRRDIYLKPYRGHIFIYSRDYEYLMFVPRDNISVTTTQKNLNKVRNKHWKAKERFRIPVTATIEGDGRLVKSQNITGFMTAAGWDKLDALLKTLDARHGGDDGEYR